MAKGKPVSSAPMIVTVTDAAIGDIQGVAKRLSAKGFAVERVLPLTGVVAGSGPLSAMAELRAVAGVESVEQEVEASPSDE